MAASTEFTFAKRERLTEVISTRMDKLYKTFGSFAAQDTARILKILLNNIVRDPFEPKYRNVIYVIRSLRLRLWNVNHLYPY